MNIFVVEDDDLQRRVLTQNLMSIEGADVSAFSNVDACLDEVNKTSAPIILISDIRMPIRSGVSLLKELVQYENIVGLVVVSGIEQELLDSVYYITEQLGIPNVELFAKPVRVNQVTDSVKQMIINQFDSRAEETVSKKQLTKAELMASIFDSQFEPYFQPQVDTVLKEVRGVEILGRLHRDKQVFFPDSFIKQLIQYDLITQYTYLILEKAISVMQSAQYQRLKLSINVDYASLRQPDFALRIIQLLSDLKFPPERLIVEVTENRSDLGLAVVSNLTELRLVGVTLSIDDFGTGHSGVVELLTLPFSELKFDRSYVQNLHGSKKLKHMISGLCALCQTLNLYSVAEGVETQERAAYLHKLGVTYQQGFLYSKAVCRKELASTLKLVTSQLKHMHFGQSSGHIRLTSAS